MYWILVFSNFFLSFSSTNPQGVYPQKYFIVQSTPNTQEHENYLVANQAAYSLKHNRFHLENGPLFHKMQLESLELIPRQSFISMCIHCKNQLDIILEPGKHIFNIEFPIKRICSYCQGLNFIFLNLNYLVEEHSETSANLFSVPSSFSNQLKFLKNKTIIGDNKIREKSNNQKEKIISNSSQEIEPKIYKKTNSDNTIDKNLLDEKGDTENHALLTYSEAVIKNKNLCETEKVTSRNPLVGDNVLNQKFKNKSKTKLQEDTTVKSNNYSNLKQKNNSYYDNKISKTKSKILEKEDSVKKKEDDIQNKSNDGFITIKYKKQGKNKDLFKDFLINENEKEIDNNDNMDAPNKVKIVDEYIKEDLDSEKKLNVEKDALDKIKKSSQGKYIEKTSKLDEAEIKQKSDNLTNHENLKEKETFLNDNERDDLIGNNDNVLKDSKTEEEVEDGNLSSEFSKNIKQKSTKPKSKSKKIKKIDKNNKDCSGKNLKDEVVFKETEEESERSKDLENLNGFDSKSLLLKNTFKDIANKVYLKGDPDKGEKYFFEFSFMTSKNQLNISDLKKMHDFLLRQMKNYYNHKFNKEEVTFISALFLYFYSEIRPTDVYLRLIILMMESYNYFDKDRSMFIDFIIFLNFYLKDRYKIKNSEDTQGKFDGCIWNKNDMKAFNVMSFITFFNKLYLDKNMKKGSKTINDFDKVFCNPKKLNSMNLRIHKNELKTYHEQEKQNIKIFFDSCNVTKDLI